MSHHNRDHHHNQRDYSSNHYNQENSAHYNNPSSGSSRRASSNHADHYGSASSSSGGGYNNVRERESNTYPNDQYGRNSYSANDNYIVSRPHESSYSDNQSNVTRRHSHSSGYDYDREGGNRHYEQRHGASTTYHHPTGAAISSREPHHNSNYDVGANYAGSRSYDTTVINSSSSSGQDLRRRNSYSTPNRSNYETSSYHDTAISGGEERRSTSAHHYGTHHHYGASSSAEGHSRVNSSPHEDNLGVAQGGSHHYSNPRGSNSSSNYQYGGSSSSSSSNQNINYQYGGSSSSSSSNQNINYQYGGSSSSSSHNIIDRQRHQDDHRRDYSNVYGAPQQAIYETNRDTNSSVRMSTYGDSSRRSHPYSRESDRYNREQVAHGSNTTDHYSLQQHARYDTHRSYQYGGSSSSSSTATVHSNNHTASRVVQQNHQPRNSRSHSMTNSDYHQVNINPYEQRGGSSSSSSSTANYVDNQQRHLDHSTDDTRISNNSDDRYHRQDDRRQREYNQHQSYHTTDNNESQNITLYQGSSLNSSSSTNYGNHLVQQAGRSREEVTPNSSRSNSNTLRTPTNYNAFNSRPIAGVQSHAERIEVSPVLPQRVDVVDNAQVVVPMAAENDVDTVNILAVPASSASLTNHQNINIGQRTAGNNSSSSSSSHPIEIESYQHRDLQEAGGLLRHEVATQRDHHYNNNQVTHHTTHGSIQQPHEVHASSSSSSSTAQNYNNSATNTIPELSHTSLVQDSRQTSNTSSSNNMIQEESSPVRVGSKTTDGGTNSSQMFPEYDTKICVLMSTLRDLTVLEAEVALNECGGSVNRAREMLLHAAANANNNNSNGSRIEGGDNTFDIMDDQESSSEEEEELSSNSKKKNFHNSKDVDLRIKNESKTSNSASSNSTLLQQKSSTTPADNDNTKKKSPLYGGLKPFPKGNFSINTKSKEDPNQVINSKLSSSKETSKSSNFIDVKMGGEFIELVDKFKPKYSESDAQISWECRIANDLFNCRAVAGRIFAGCVNSSGFKDHCKNMAMSNSDRLALLILNTAINQYMCVHELGTKINALKTVSLLDKKRDQSHTEVIEIRSSSSEEEGSRRRIQRPPTPPPPPRRINNSSNNSRRSSPSSEVRPRRKLQPLPTSEGPSLTRTPSFSSRLLFSQLSAQRQRSSSSSPDSSGDGFERDLVGRRYNMSPESGDNGMTKRRNRTSPTLRNSDVRNNTTGQSRTSKEVRNDGNNIVISSSSSSSSSSTNALALAKTSLNTGGQHTTNTSKKTSIVITNFNQSTQNNMEDPLMSANRLAEAAAVKYLQECWLSCVYSAFLNVCSARARVVGQTSKDHYLTSTTVMSSSQKSIKRSKCRLAMTPYNFEGYMGGLVDLDKDTRSDIILSLHNVYDNGLFVASSAPSSSHLDGFSTEGNNKHTNTAESMRRLIVPINKENFTWPANSAIIPGVNKKKNYNRILDYDNLIPHPTYWTRDKSSKAHPVHVRKRLLPQQLNALKWMLEREQGYYPGSCTSHGSDGGRKQKTIIDESGSSTLKNSSSVGGGLLSSSSSSAYTDIKSNRYSDQYEKNYSTGSGNNLKSQTIVASGEGEETKSSVTTFEARYMKQVLDYECEMKVNYELKARGGILSEPIGHGKTAIALALIAYDRDMTSELKSEIYNSTHKMNNTLKEERRRKQKNRLFRNPSSNFHDPHDGIYTDTDDTEHDSEENTDDDEFGFFNRPSKSSTSSNPIALSSKSSSMTNNDDHMMDVDPQYDRVIPNEKGDKNPSSRNNTKNKSSSSPKLPNSQPVDSPSSCFFDLSKRTTLILAPQALLEQWENEITKFTPTVRVCKFGLEKGGMAKVVNRPGSFQHQQPKKGKQNWFDNKNSNSQKDDFYWNVLVISSPKVLKHVTHKFLAHFDVVLCTLNVYTSGFSHCQRMRIQKASTFGLEWLETNSSVVGSNKPENLKISNKLTERDLRYVTKLMIEKEAKVAASIKGSSYVDSELLGILPNNQKTNQNNKPSAKQVVKGDPTGGHYLLLEQCYWKRVIVDEVHELCMLEEQDLLPPLLQTRSKYFWGVTGTPQVDSVKSVAQLAMFFGVDIIGPHSIDPPRPPQLLGTDYSTKLEESEQGLKAAFDFVNKTNWVDKSKEKLALKNEWFVRPTSELVQTATQLLTIQHIMARKQLKNRHFQNMNQGGSNNLDKNSNTNDTKINASLNQNNPASADKNDNKTTTAKGLKGKGKGNTTVPKNGAANHGKSGVIKNNNKRRRNKKGKANQQQQTENSNNNANNRNATNINQNNNTTTQDSANNPVTAASSSSSSNVNNTSIVAVSSSSTTANKSIKNDSTTNSVDKTSNTNNISGVAPTSEGEFRSKWFYALSATGLQEMRTYFWDRSPDLAANAAKFVSQFVFRSTYQLDIPGVKVRDHIVVVEHTPKERALYLQQCRDLNLYGVDVLRDAAAIENGNSNKSGTNLNNINATSPYMTARARGGSYYMSSRRNSTSSRLSAIPTYSYDELFTAYNTYCLPTTNQVRSVDKNGVNLKSNGKSTLRGSPHDKPALLDQLKSSGTRNDLDSDQDDISPLTNIADDNSSENLLKLDMRYLSAEDMESYSKRTKLLKLCSHYSLGSGDLGFSEEEACKAIFSKYREEIGLCNKKLRLCIRITEMARKIVLHRVVEPEVIAVDKTHNKTAGILMSEDGHIKDNVASSSSSSSSSSSANTNNRRVENLQRGRGGSTSDNNRRSPRHHSTPGTLLRNNSPSTNALLTHNNNNIGTDGLEKQSRSTNFKTCPKENSVLVAARDLEAMRKRAYEYSTTGALDPATIAMIVQNAMKKFSKGSNSENVKNIFGRALLSSKDTLTTEEAIILGDSIQEEHTNKSSNGSGKDNTVVDMEVDGGTVNDSSSKNIPSSSSSSSTSKLLAGDKQIVGNKKEEDDSEQQETGILSVQDIIDYERKLIATTGTFRDVEQLEMFVSIAEIEKRSTKELSKVGISNVKNKELPKKIEESLKSALSSGPPKTNSSGTSPTNNSPTNKNSETTVVDAKCLKDFTQMLISAGDNASRLLQAAYTNESGGTSGSVKDEEAVSPFKRTRSRSPSLSPAKRNASKQSLISEGGVDGTSRAKSKSPGRVLNSKSPTRAGDSANTDNKNVATTTSNASQPTNFQPQQVNQADYLSAYLKKINKAEAMKDLLTFGKDEDAQSLKVPAEIRNEIERVFAKLCKEGKKTQQQQLKRLNKKDANSVDEKSAAEQSRDMYLEYVDLITASIEYTGRISNITNTVDIPKNSTNSNLILNDENSNQQGLPTVSQSAVGKSNSARNRRKRAKKQQQKSDNNNFSNMSGLVASSSHSNNGGRYGVPKSVPRLTSMSSSALSEEQLLSSEQLNLKDHDDPQNIIITDDPKNTNTNTKSSKESDEKTKNLKITPTPKQIATAHRLYSLFVNIEAALFQQFAEVLKNMNEKMQKYNFFASTLDMAQRGENDNCGECPICLEDDIKVADLSITPCSHVFCTRCIDQHLKHHNQCPSCRANITANKIQLLQSELTVIKRNSQYSQFTKKRKLQAKDKGSSKKDEDADTADSKRRRLEDNKINSSVIENRDEHRAASFNQTMQNMIRAEQQHDQLNSVVSMASILSPTNHTGRDRSSKTSPARQSSGNNVGSSSNLLVKKGNEDDDVEMQDEDDNAPRKKQQQSNESSAQRKLKPFIQHPKSPNNQSSSSNKLFLPDLSEDKRTTNLNLVSDVISSRKKGSRKTLGDIIAADPNFRNSKTNHGLSALQQCVVQVGKFTVHLNPPTSSINQSTGFSTNAREVLSSSQTKDNSQINSSSSSSSANSIRGSTAANPETNKHLPLLPFPAIAGAAKLTPQERQFRECGSKIQKVVQTLLEIERNSIALTPKNRERSIIFCQWDDLRAKIRNALTRYNIESISLKGNAMEKAKILRDFRHGNGPRNLLLSLDKAASGADLSIASHVLFVHPFCAESIDKAVAYENQAIGRIRRFGQQAKEIHVWRFMTANTLEQTLTEEHVNMFDEH